ncbi:MAG: DMT family transporter [Lentisphaeria bacterium]|nr:DMT family transporter [Lentisphaeria bacterium]
MGVIFALCSLACSAVNDFLFKLLTGKKTSRGLFVSLAGLCCVLALLPAQGEWKDVKSTLIWGCVSGMFSLVGNIFLIEAMARQSAGICATIYRLNLVAVVLGAWLFLGEKMNSFLITGVICATAAVLCFLGGSNDGSGKKAVFGTVLVIIASLLRAGMGLTYKYGFSHAADPNGVALINGMFWVVGGIFYAALKGELKGGLDWRLLRLGLLSGLLIAGIVYFMAKSVAVGDVSIVIPIAQMSFIVTFLLSIIFLKEKINFAKAAGVILGIAAIILLSR